MRVKMDIQWFYHRWQQLFPNLDPVLSDNVLRTLLQHYQEPHRFYHTLDHIHACLLHLDTVRARLVDPYSVELALWFHDVIYQPQQADNEEQSAQLAYTELMKYDLDKPALDRIIALIRLTQHPSQPYDDDECLLLDIDLAILGSAEPTYDNYEHWIRQEYLFVPEPLYRQGRSQVLQSFLQQPQIYHSDFFCTQWEDQARRNLNRAIDRLQSPP